MPSANGVNFKLTLPESIKTNIMYLHGGAPNDPTKVSSWTEFGREFTKKFKWYGEHPDVTLDDLVSLGLRTVPFDYADALVREATRNKAHIAVSSRWTVTVDKDIWRDLINAYTNGRIEMYTDPATGVMQGVTLSLSRLIVELKRALDDKAKLREIISNRRGLSDVAIPAPVHPITPMQRIKNHEKFFREKQVSLKREVNVLSKIEMLPHGTRASRTWGIEIEAVAAFGIERPKGWQAKGDGSLRAADHMTHDADCAKALDSSMRCTCGLDHDQPCKEFVSPITTSYHSRGLQFLTEKLAGRPTNRTPGIHVHVNATTPDSKAMTPKQIASLIHGYNLLEPLWAYEYHRDKSRIEEYCRPLNPNEVYNAASRLKQTEKSNPKIPHRQVSTGLSGRYYATNAAALARHGTIEFRAMGPIYNYEHLIRWAHFLREMMNVAQSEFPISGWGGVKTFDDLIKVFAKYGKETVSPNPAAHLSPDQFVTERELVAAGINED